MPSESCTLIGGGQGKTKNLFAYDLIARVTTGEPWPDEPLVGRRPPRNVILLEAEEHLESSIVPRLIAAGADLQRVTVVKGAPAECGDNTRFVSIQRDAVRIERLANQIGDVALIVVSPITSYLGSVEQNKNEQVRNEVIHPLKELAERVRCAVVILKHPNKDWKNTDPLGRIAGSTAWTEAMRCVIYVGTDPDEPPDAKNPLRAAHWVKFSIGPTPDPLGWRVAVAPNDAPKVCYVDDAITFTAHDMLLAHQQRSDRQPSKREQAAEWITAALALGPKRAADLLDEARGAIAQGVAFSLDAFERAKTELRAAGKLHCERRPGSTPAEWWYWLAEHTPAWHPLGAERGSSSASSSRARADSHTCGSCGSSSGNEGRHTHDQGNTEGEGHEEVERSSSATTASG